jgi:Amiloride-sensitive sodium channel
LQTSQTGGQWYSDSSLFSIPWRIDGDDGKFLNRRRQKIRREQSMTLTGFFANTGGLLGLCVGFSAVSLV